MGFKESLESYLKENKVPFQLHHHPPAYTAQAVAESEHISGRMVAKVVMARAGDKMVMLVVPANLKVNLDKAAAAIGVKELRLAGEDEFAEAFPGCEVGAMPPLGHLYGFDTFVDRALTADETIVFQAGTHEDTVHMKRADFERLEQPRIADLAAA